MMTPLERAIEIAGGQRSVAKALSVGYRTVNYWVHRKGCVPGEHVVPLERLTDGLVTRHELRPDLFPPPAGNGAQTP